MLAPPAPHNTDLNWEAFNPSVLDLQSLQDDFTEAEILKALELLPGDKAPGPEGFSINFYKAC